MGKKIATNIGLYWGTFDPPTLAHATIIINAMEQLKLSKLIVVVNDNQGTKKNYKSPGLDRVKMIKSIIPNHLKSNVLVIRQTDEFLCSYSFFKKRYVEGNLVAIVGQDSFNLFSQYCANCDSVAVVPRGPESDNLSLKIQELNLTNTSVLKVDAKFLNYSSTYVRTQVGKNIRDIPDVDPLVCQYIHDHGFFKFGFEAKHHIAANTIQRVWKARSPDIQIIPNGP